MTTHELGFRYRYGLKNDIDNAPYIDGSFNFSTDSGEFSIDKGGQRIPMNNILVYNTIAEVEALENPTQKIYLALDTMTLYHYNTETLEWEYVGINGLTDTFATREYAENVSSRLDTLTNVVNSINRFNIIVIPDGENLPEEGTSFTIYFIDASFTKEDGTKKNIYDEYMWLPDLSYYEQIGSSEVDMDLYYKKTEIDDKLSVINQTITDNAATEKNDKENTDAAIKEVNTTIGTIQSRIETIEDGIVNGNTASALMSDDIDSLNSRVSTLETDNTTNKSNIASLQSDNTTNKSNISTLLEDNDTNKYNIDNLKTDLTAAKSDLSNNYAKKENAVSSITLNNNKLVLTLADGTTKSVDLNFILYNESNDIFDGGDIENE